MGARTYIPTLVKILKTMCEYIVKYRSVIEKVIGEGSHDALDALVAACDVFMALADPFIDRGD